MAVLSLLLTMSTLSISTPLSIVSIKKQLLCIIYINVFYGEKKAQNLKKISRFEFQVFVGV